MKANYNNINITSAEIASLWSQYVNDSASVCVLTYFSNKVEDSQVRSMIELALSSSKSHIKTLKDLFNKENFPIPVGFTQEDVNLDAPRLFSDSFFLSYLKNMSMLGMTANSMAIGLATRSDIVAFHKKILSETVHLHRAITEVLLAKGLYIRPPYITTPDQVDFVINQDFLGKLIGDQRPLTSIEISHLYLNIETNLVGKEMMMAFAQVAKRKEVKQYLLRGKQIADKHVNIFSKVLLSNDIPAAMVWDTAVTDSTTSTFSDKLMMFHVTAMSAAGVGNYSTAIAASPRKDIALKYARLLMEVSFYEEDGANIMIDHAWFEKPPQAPNRKQLAK